MQYSKKSLVKVGGLLAVLLLLVALYYFLRKGGKEGFEGAATIVTYYYLPECPWCKQFKPKWDAFVALAKKEGIQTAEVDASDSKNQDVVGKKGIKGFPTVLVTKDGKDHEFTGDREAAELMKFVKSLP